MRICIALKNPARTSFSMPNVKPCHVQTTETFWSHLKSAVRPKMTSHTFANFTRHMKNFSERDKKVDLDQRFLAHIE